MPPMTQDEIQKLKALALAGTPGDWEAKPMGRIIGGPLRHYPNGSARSQIASCSVTFHDQAPDDEPERQQANAEFIAAFNPSVALSLIAQLEARPAVVDAQWLPIESAPKDRLIMLGRLASEEDDHAAISTPGRWFEGEDDGPDNMGSDGGFMDVEFQQFSFPRSFGNEKYRAAGLQPTHWQELPAPPCSTAPTAPVAAVPDDSELQFNATRLRNVARLVGVNLDLDDAKLDEARGAVLGQIAYQLRRGAQYEQHDGKPTPPSDGVTSPAKHDFTCDQCCPPAQAVGVDLNVLRDLLKPEVIGLLRFKQAVAHITSLVQAAKQDGREQADKWRNLAATQREALDVARATNAINADLARAEGRLEGLEQAAERIDSANDSAGDRAAYENRDMICCETERMQALTHAAELVRALATQPSPKPEGGA